MQQGTAALLLVHRPCLLSRLLLRGSDLPVHLPRWAGVPSLWPLVPLLAV